MKRSDLLKSTLANSFSAIRLLFFLAVLALAGCSPDAGITAPDVPDGDGTSPEVLESRLNDLIRAFEADLAAGRFGSAPAAGAKQNPSAGPVLSASMAINYYLTNTQTDNLDALVLGTACPAPIIQFDTARIVDVLALDSTNIADMNAALAVVGGSVTLEHKMQESFSVKGSGSAGYSGMLLTGIRHAAGGQTTLDQTPMSGASIPGTAITNRVTFTVSLSASDVASMAPGDALVTAALGVGAADAGGCANGDEAILGWQRPNGGNPILKLLP
jgi:hypothetical protein